MSAKRVSKAYGRGEFPPTNTHFSLHAAKILVFLELCKNRRPKKKKYEPQKKCIVFLEIGYHAYNKHTQQEVV